MNEKFANSVKYSNVPEFLFSLNLKTNVRLSFEMSQSASNSIYDNKSMSILIFCLIFLNVSHLTSGTPTEFPAAFENVKNIVQPETSSYWGLGDMISYGVQSIQSAIKYVIGVEDHPREFYVVHIKDEKNPANNRDVLRERGREGDTDDIPVKGGKLPVNSLIVESKVPITEYVSSPEVNAPQPAPSTTGVSDKNVPVVESEPLNGNNASTKGTNDQGENNSPTENLPHHKEDADIKSPSSSTAETQILPKENVETESTPDREPETGASTADTNLTKSGNGQLHQTDTVSDGQDHHSQGELSKDSQNPAHPQSGNKMNPSLGGNSLKPAQNEHETLISNDHEYPAGMPAASQVKDQHQPEYNETDGPNIASWEQNNRHYNNLSTLAQNHHTVDFIDNGISQSQIPPIPQNSNLDTKKHHPANLMESHISQTTHPGTHEPESLSFDPNESISMNECEIKYGTELCERDPNFCGLFQSDEDLVAYVKKNSDCSPKGHVETHSPANNPDQFSKPHSYQHEGNLENGQNLGLSLTTEELQTPIAYLEESHVPQPKHPNTHEPKSLSFDPNESISMNECEIKFGTELCERDPNFCGLFQSNEDLFAYVKKNSNCSSKRQVETHSPENNPDQFSKPHSYQYEENLGNGQNLRLSLTTEELQAPITYLEESHVPQPQHSNTTHKPESLSFDPNELISMSECEIEFERELCEHDSNFCKQFKSGEEFIKYVKEYSNCSPKGQQAVEIHPPVDEPDQSSKSFLYDPSQIISMSECETKFERQLCGNNPELCEKFQSEEKFIDYVKRNSGCASGGQENGEHNATGDGAGKDPSHQVHQSLDLVSAENFGGYNLNDDGNDALSNSQFEPIESPKKKNNTTNKKKSKSKEKGSKSKL